MLKTLNMDNIVGGYGEKRILNKVSLYVQPSEILGLLGPNGSGKSTVLKAIFGLVKVEQGQIIFNDVKIHNRKSSLIATEGIVYIPQGNNVFGQLTVHENLELGGFIVENQKKIKQRIEDVYELFPALKKYRNRLAGKMSGGERQMLGISRGLIQHPKMMILDEPSIGLAPILVRKVLKTLLQIRDQFNLTVLVVEQNVRELLKVVDRIYVIRLGEIILEESNITIDTEEQIRKVFLS